MPAKYIRRDHKTEGYFHILNKGISGKTILKDGQDYEVFLNYLKDYLTPPSDLDTYKKDFTVKGRTFRGVPHQTRNYFNEIHLIAYSLMPNHFHLLLHQTTKGSLENFMRSLSTRYSMYFNKKYQCTGSLFEGPYKSIRIEGTSSLLLLTRHLHRGLSNDTDNYTSYAEYLGKRQTSWLKPDAVLSFFYKSQNKTYKGTHGYKNFVEKYEPDQKEENLLEGIILEKEFEHLEGITPPPTRSNPYEKISSDGHIKAKLRLFEYSIATSVFILLFSLGYRNVLSSSAKNTTPKDVISINSISSPSPAPVVAGTKDEKTKTMLLVKTDNGLENINIRQNPTVQSEIVGTAKNGDIFGFVSINSGWFGAKLEDGSTGYISSKFIEIIEEAGI